jgi:membrane protein implicated in regulation of membrane protease activity
MTAAVIWLIAGIALLVSEALTGTFVLLMLGGGALAAAASSAFLGTSPLVDTAVFGGVSVVLLGLARPALRRRTDTVLEPAHESPIGTSGLVVQRVDAHSGQIKIEGELWSARALDHERVYEPGERVTVLRLSGVTAVVGAEI